MSLVTTSGKVIFDLLNRDQQDEILSAWLDTKNVETLDRICAMASKKREQLQTTIITLIGDEFYLKTIIVLFT